MVRRSAAFEYITNGAAAAAKLEGRRKGRRQYRHGICAHNFLQRRALADGLPGEADHHFAAAGLFGQRNAAEIPAVVESHLTALGGLALLDAGCKIRVLAARVFPDYGVEVVSACTGLAIGDELHAISLHTGGINALVTGGRKRRVAGLPGGNSRAQVKHLQLLLRLRCCWLARGCLINRLRHRCRLRRCGGLRFRGIACSHFLGQAFQVSARQIGPETAGKIVEEGLPGLNRIELFCCLERFFLADTATAAFLAGRLVASGLCFSRYWNKVRNGGQTKRYEKQPNHTKSDGPASYLYNYCSTDRYSDANAFYSQQNRDEPSKFPGCVDCRPWAA
jgi:hypothetical protein